MMKIKKIFGIVAVLLLSACNVDNEVYDSLPAENFPENESQLESITLSAYNEQRHLLDDWGWWLYMQEVSSDVLVFPQRGTDWEDGGKWRVLHRHTWLPSSAGVNGMWFYLYSVVSKCNQAIEYLASDSEAANLARAEMAVLRSHMYYLLIDNYGAVPYTESFSEAEEFPYRVKRADINSRLIDVVHEAIQYLPEAGATDNQVINKSMAWMLLGKLYLNSNIYTGSGTFAQADMDSVVSMMNNVIGSGEYALEDDRFAPFSYNNSSSTENIFTILCDESYDDGLRQNHRTLHTLHKSTFDFGLDPWNGCAIKPDFYTNLFASNDGFDDADDNTSLNDEVIDQRASAFARGQQYDMDGNELSNDNGNLILTLNITADVMADGTDGGAETRFSGYRVIKYTPEVGATEMMNNDFPVYRLADAYLMRAEATLRGGSGADASADDDLNKTRNQAGLEDVTATLDELIDERGREMFLEGHRRSDLIRFGLFADRDWWLGAAESDPGVDRLTFPVAQDQLDANPNLEADPISLNL